MADQRTNNGIVTVLYEGNELCDATPPDGEARDVPDEADGQRASMRVLSTYSRFDGCAAPEDSRNLSRSQRITGTDIAQAI
jgi:hypothetical protein